MQALPGPSSFNEVVVINEFSRGGMVIIFKDSSFGFHSLNAFLNHDQAEIMPTSI